MTVKIDTINISDNKVTKKQYKFEPIEEINLGLLHQVVKGSRTNFRNNTASVKTRAQVSGTGAKPWAQKGTGRARQGSLRSPQLIGGGIAHGPGTRVYRDRTPKPVAPFLLSDLAGPAISKCIHLFSSINSSRIKAAVIAPPYLPPVFFISAMSDSISFL